MSEAIESVPLSAARARARRRWWGRRRLIATLVLLLAASLAAGRAATWYRGMSEGMWHQMRYATFAESRNLLFCVEYFLDQMEMLRFDPAAGLWSFRLTPEAGRDDFERAVLAFHRGDFTGAIRLLESDLDRRGDSEEVLFWLALTYMRRAEAENCLSKLKEGDARHHQHGQHATLCTLPITRFHDRKEDSRQAMRLFERLLDHYGSDNQLYLWLLNFSAMTVDGYPAAVPERYRVQTPFLDAYYGETAERTRRRYSWLRLTDRAAELGVENLGTGRGVAVEDFDGDGDLDMVTGAFFGTLRLFRNDAGQRFTEATAVAGLAGVTQPLTVSAADYDNNGSIDLFVVRPFEHFRLFANNGQGRFTDVTSSSGLLEVKPAGTVAASWFSTWGDVDNDGDLDLFLSSWAFRVPFVRGLVGEPRLDSKLFINDRGRFRDATADYGLAELLYDRQFIGAAFGDYDADGWSDLYIAGPIPATNALLQNIEGRRFVKRQDLADPPEPGFTAGFVDINQDGRLDIFQGGFNDARTAVAQSVFRKPGDPFPYKMGPSFFLVQTADGRFEKRSDLFAGGVGVSTMGTSWGDLDNDGCFDVYLGTGNPEPWFILPNFMYLGRRQGGRCTGEMDDISMLNSFATIQKGHGIAFFDFDGDGDQDVFSNLGGMWPADDWVSQLFVNESDLRNQWTKIRLRGRRTNSRGVGATLKITALRPDGSRIVRYRQMDNATGFGSAPYLAHVGLMDATAVEGVEVYWPASRCRRTYSAALRELNILDEADCLRAAGP